MTERQNLKLMVTVRELYDSCLLCHYALSDYHKESRDRQVKDLRAMLNEITEESLR